MTLVRDDSREFGVSSGPPRRVDVLPLAGAVASAVLILAVIVRGKK